MANEAYSSANRTVSFLIRLLVGLLLPGWGIVLIVLGIIAGMGWWIATGVVVLVIGVLFAGSSLVTPFFGGRPFA
ncbi:MAG TPA: hypothetical protein VHY56_10640 [Candidatus Binataceae bacterium]|nr:hypothetical protein [Candidatus Binataceae bacterium]